MYFKKYTTKQNILSVFIYVALFTSVSSVFAWTAPEASAPNINEPAPLNVGTGYQFRGYLLGLYGDGAGIRVSRVLDYSISSTPPNSRTNNLLSLLMGANGRMGAKEYCDEWGNNCMTIRQIKAALGI
ncbi:MAG: hypothetical protein QG568_277 [Patescibacteria group bacterium]|nr:hypothetical protein [Patescibacteria group bacterium]